MNAAATDRRTRPERQTASWRYHSQTSARRNSLTSASGSSLSSFSVTRTRASGPSRIDADSKPFTAYSPDYAAKKAKYRGIGTGNVNLRGMGPGVQMLDTIGVTAVTENSVTIGFRTARASELGMYHDALGAGRSKVVRRFFDVSKGFMDRAAQLVKAGWKK